MELGILFGVVALFVAFIDWRRGVLIAVVVGFLADPVRKLIPGQPVVLTVAVAVFVGASLAGALQRHGWGAAAGLLRRHSVLKTPLQLFFLWVGFAAVMTVVTYGSLILAGIGTIAYLAPIPGIFLAYYYADSLESVRRFVGVYLMACVAMISGIYLKILGFDWEILEQVGPRMFVSSLGWVYGGFFRTPEVAAWHAGTGVCLLVLFGTAVWRPGSKPLVAVLAVVLVAAGILTGRRKMIGQILLFVSMYGLLLLHFRRGAKRLVVLGFVVVLVGGLAFNELLARSERGVRYSGFVERGSSVLEDAPKRAGQIGLGSIYWAFRRYGLLGGGAGISSQGAQHFGGGVQLAGGSGEGGLGKIVLELGLPGLALAFWLGVAVVKSLWRSMNDLARSSPGLVGLVAGFGAFLAAQVPTFAVASQIYGDPFVLVTIGSVLGFAFAVGSWTHSGEDLRATESSG